jgi:chemotaxis family two-component system sensor kinase Cph1
VEERVHPPESPVILWDKGAYSIKRHGVSFTKCDAEPVQTPGCIQAHGALLVLRLPDLTILQASENTLELLGIRPDALLGRSVTVVVQISGQERLVHLMQTQPVERNPLYAFTQPAVGPAHALDVTLHTVDEVAVLEFEATGRANETRGDYLSLLKSAVHDLQSAAGLREFCQRMTDEVRALTGLDRVMVYRFHPDNHGEVFAESKRGDMVPWLGLHYPETDIPKPAREIFSRIWIRPLPHAAGELVELVPLTNPDTGRPLNMTHCALRGASRMYTEYLANMGVAASLTLSLRRDGQLWGLVAGNHETPLTFSHEVRSTCEFLAQVASLQLKSAEQNEQQLYRLRLEAVHQQLVAKAMLDGDLMALTDRTPSLLDAMDAGGAALHHLDRWWCVGNTPSPPQLDAFADWLEARSDFDSPVRPVFSTDALSLAYPAGSEIADMASGVLAVPLSRHRRDLIVWFRPEKIHTVRWAGSPYEKPAATGANGPQPRPRRSFAPYLESVRQRSQAWLPVEIDSALHLRMLVMELVVSRTERLAELNADLTRSNDELDAFAYVASHDLKEPLRGIHKFAHQLLESAQIFDAESRRRVDSLMRLTVRMDSLLDSLLHFSRVGRTNLELEAVDLNQVVDEAVEMIGGRRVDSLLDLRIPRLLPVWRSDRVRVREIFMNLLSNALKYTRQESPLVEVGFERSDDTVARRGAAADGGHTVFFVKDNGIGIDARHFEQVFRLFKRLHGREEFGGGIGAGLTIVQKLVQRHGGQIWLESTLGVGSTFYFTLPCGESVSS